MKFTNDFFSPTSTDPADDLVQLVDSYSLENVNYQKVTHWYHEANPVAMTDALCDGIIYRKRNGEYYALTSFLAGKPINIELFGAKGDATTDDTQAFLKAADFVNRLYDFVSVDPNNPSERFSLELQSVTLVGNSPVGYKITNTILFKKPVNFIVDRIFYRGTSDKTALIFQNSFKNTITTNISGTPVANASSDNYVGILLQGSQHCKMYLGASFFTKGIVCDANDSPGIFSGFAWNEIQLKSMQSNLDAFVIRNSNNGWANANRVIGGEFGSFTGLLDVSTVTRRRTFVKFEKDAASKGCNSWLFLNQAFEWGHDLDPWETLCFDFSAAPCYGISISEPRIEIKTGERIGIFHRGSEFNFNSNQIHYLTYFTDQDGVKYIGEKPVVLLDEDLSGDSKTNGSDSHFYVKNLEPFNELTGLFPNADYDNQFCQVFKINDHNTNLWVQWHRYAQFVLFDENRNIITDSALLQAQIDLLDFRPQDYWIAPGITSDVKIIKIGAEDEGDYVNNMYFIPEAKYVGIIQRQYDNARLKVMINRADRGKIEKVKFLQIPSETYSTVNDPSDSSMVGFNFNTGEKFYNFNTHKTTVIKESGVGSTLSGYTVDAVVGSRTFTVKTGDMAKLSLGTIFYVNTAGGAVRFKIAAKAGNVIMANIPSHVTMTDADITFPICTFDTY
ncbi:hypothetical protein SAMN05421594_3741 [Chryseobacterium oleae]|uniref:Uncharacterized protein n=1 Tax=Chryseobacterium oleae TaxID=491207 RepID=A0A1I5AWH2_CHROL|nr:hypothetical protein [Chryseobacterium oleae]SFN66788.1 hypothetical protein SAMN05421594_3741 [Chryseobacterium oleae]